MVSDKEMREYLHDEAHYELERMLRDEQEEREEFEQWCAVQADYFKSLGVEQCHRPQC